ncbi:MAG: hypothetical protein MUC95_06295, partial [Spirochaetes bacterium]|nr:hypothetical protein [Spirochaetota bacterium]
SHAAAEENIIAADNQSFCVPWNLSFEMTFNTKDLLLGFDYNLFFLKKYQILCDAFFYFRPYKKTVFIEESEDHYYQLKEHRFAFGADVQKIFRLYEYHGLYISGGAAYTFGSFAGTEAIESEGGYTPVAGCGYVVSIGEVLYLKMGYQFIKIPAVPSNRLYLEISVYI